MYDLTSPAVIRHLCDAFGFSFKKSYGQNFLTDASVLLRIAKEAGEDGVLEIGPGFGSLTAALAQRAKKVVSVELDETLAPILQVTLAGFDNIDLVFSDIMKTDVNALLKEHFGNMPVSVAANLPYYVTTPILMRLLEEKLPFRDIVVMVQKEVAERIVASPGGKDYGALTLAVSYYAEPSIIAHVPAESFVPSPKVDSAVVKMHLRNAPPIGAEEAKYFAVVKAAFAQRRKTLANALANAGRFGDKQTVTELLESLGIHPSTRGETLSMEAFSEIAEAFDRL